MAEGRRHVREESQEGEKNGRQGKKKERTIKGKVK